MAPDTENPGPELIDPTGLLRLLFWLIWLAGTVLLLITWLLVMVPGHVSIMDLSFRASAAGLLLTATLLAGWLWKFRSPLMRAFVLVVWIELIIAVAETGG